MGDILMTTDWKESELTQTNFDVTPSGQIVSWRDCPSYIKTEFGLQAIESEEA